jgi:hypothetical protein
MAGIRIPSGSRPAFLVAIPPLRYSDIRVSGVSFPFLWICIPSYGILTYSGVAPPLLTD